MKTWLKWLAAVAVLGLVAAVLVYWFVYNKPHRDYEKASPEFELTAEELYLAFIDNRNEAESKYNGRVLQITGQISDIEEIEDMVIVVFSFSEGLFGDEGVRCTMLENHSEKALSLQPGDEVLIKGFCTGFSGSDVILEFCSFP
ncbi:MAG: hypothetical protein EA393_04135 [Bacteroidetes bacterium]|nr:MAG: hypothetical protein EA393_04135 [Bacteroidota bacterium]